MKVLRASRCEGYFIVPCEEEVIASSQHLTKKPTLKLEGQHSRTFKCHTECQVSMGLEMCVLLMHACYCLRNETRTNLRYSFSSFLLRVQYPFTHFGLLSDDFSPVSCLFLSPLHALQSLFRGQAPHVRDPLALTPKVILERQFTQGV